MRSAWGSRSANLSTCRWKFASELARGIGLLPPGTTDECPGRARAKSDGRLDGAALCRWLFLELAELSDERGLGAVFGGLADCGTLGPTENVFARCILPGAARGPPGIDGEAGCTAGLEGPGFDCVDAMIGGRNFVRTFDGDCGLVERSPPPLSLRTLVFRPSDAKNPVPEPFVPDNGI